MNTIEKLIKIIILLFLVGAFGHAFANDRQRAAELGWQVDSNPDLYCDGYYIEPFLGLTQDEPLESQETQISADQSSFYQTGSSTLSGDVLLVQHGRILSAERAILHRDVDTNRPHILELFESVELREQGKLIKSDRAEINLINNTGDLDDVLYRMALSDAVKNEIALQRLYGMNAWGRARKASRETNGHYYFKNATYSTCNPLKPAWQLSARRVKFNQDSGRALARDVLLRVKGFPVFYSPFFSYPIDDRRKTGFLFQTYDRTDSSGLSVTLPFYLNIAPNVDAIILPRYFSKRGIMLGATSRAISKNASGDAAFNYLHHDTEFSDFQIDEARNSTDPIRLRRLLDFSDDRYLLHAAGEKQFTPNWHGEFDLNHVSDDYYFQDFGRGLVKTTENQLIRQVQLDYAGHHWYHQWQVLNYQTLHPINQAHIPDSYSRLPQYYFNADYHDLFENFDYHTNGEFVFFDRPKDPDTREIFPTGFRYHLYPEITYRYQRPAGFIIPKVGLHLTKYDLRNEAPGTLADKARLIPIYSVKSGVFFERYLTLSGRDYLQTLEPVIYYLYVPYHSQVDTPTFDSSIRTFNFGQLFLPNRFSGVDRVGDANQVSVALTTRVLGLEKGSEKIRLSLGQTYYARDRKVMLCAEPGCEDDANVVGIASASAPMSPLVGSFSYHLYDAWSASANSAWDRYKRNTLNTDVSVNYSPDARHIVNFGYYFTHNGETADFDEENLHQTSLGLYWPVANQWSTIAYFNYNLSQHHSQDYFYGVEYEGCCFAFRALIDNTFVALNPNGSPEFDRAYYLQIQLKGLGNIGNSDPGDILVTHIPGYEDFLRK